MAVRFTVQDVLIFLFLCRISSATSEDLVNSLEESENNPPELNHFLRNVLQHKEDFKWIKNAIGDDAEAQQQSWLHPQVQDFSKLDLNNYDFRLDSASDQNPYLFPNYNFNKGSRRWSNRRPGRDAWNNVRKKLHRNFQRQGSYAQNVGERMRVGVFPRGRSGVYTAAGDQYDLVREKREEDVDEEKLIDNELDTGENSGSKVENIDSGYSSTTGLLGLEQAEQEMAKKSDIKVDKLDKRSMSISIIDDANVVKDIQKNKLTNAIVVTLNEKKLAVKDAPIESSTSQSPTAEHKKDETTDKTSSTSMKHQNTKLLVDNRAEDEVLRPVNKLDPSVHEIISDMVNSDGMFEGFGEKFAEKKDQLGDAKAAIVDNASITNLEDVDQPTSNVEQQLLDKYGSAAFPTKPIWVVTENPAVLRDDVPIKESQDIIHAKLDESQKMQYPLRKYKVMGYIPMKISKEEEPFLDYSSGFVQDFEMGKAKKLDAIDDPVRLKHTAYIDACKRKLIDPRVYRWNRPEFIYRARKLQAVQDDNEGEKEDYDKVNKRSEESNDEEEGDPYIGKKLQYNLKKNVESDNAEKNGETLLQDNDLLHVEELEASTDLPKNNPPQQPHIFPEFSSLDYDDLGKDQYDQFAGYDENMANSDYYGFGSPQTSYEYFYPQMQNMRYHPPYKGRNYLPAMNELDIYDEDFDYDIQEAKKKRNLPRYFKGSERVYGRENFPRRVFGGNEVEDALFAGVTENSNAQLELGNREVKAKADNVEPVDISTSINKISDPEKLLLGQKEEVRRGDEESGKSEEKPVLGGKNGLSIYDNLARRLAEIEKESTVRPLDEFMIKKSGFIKKPTIDVDSELSKDLLKVINVEPFIHYPFKKDVDKRMAEEGDVEENDRKLHQLIKETRREVQNYGQENFSPDHFLGQGKLEMGNRAYAKKSRPKRQSYRFYGPRQLNDYDYQFSNWRNRRRVKYPRSNSRRVRSDEEHEEKKKHHDFMASQQSIDTRYPPKPHFDIKEDDEHCHKPHENKHHHRPKHHKTGKHKTTPLTFEYDFKHLNSTCLFKGFKGLNPSLELKSFSNQALELLGKETPGAEEEEIPECGKINEAISGKIASDLLKEISKAGAKNKLGCHMKTCSSRKSQMKEVEKFRKNELEINVKETEKLLHKVMVDMNKVIMIQVHHRTCQKLPPELGKFLEEITKSPQGKGEEKEEHELGESFPLPPQSSRDVEAQADIQQGNYLFKVTTKAEKNREVRKKIKIVKSLLRQYDQLSDRCQTMVRPVKQFLEENLESLQSYLGEQQKEQKEQQKNLGQAMPVQSPHHVGPRKNYRKIHEDAEALERQVMIDRELENMGLDSKKSYEAPDVNLDKIVREKLDSLGKKGVSRPTVKRVGKKAFKRENDEGFSGWTASDKYNRLKEAADEMRDKRQVEERLGQLYGKEKMENRGELVRGVTFEAPLVLSLD